MDQQVDREVDQQLDQQVDQQADREEALFNQLSQKKKKRRRKVMITVLSVVAVVLLAGILGVMTLTAYVRRQFGGTGEDVLSYQVEAGSIHTLVSGSGTLEEEDLETLDVPEGVEIDEVMVEDNQAVKAGDLLATVNMDSVLTALADTQEAIEDLDKDIADAKDDTVSGYVSARLSGRVKQLFGEEGTDVAACMAENSALAVLSLDGYMAVDLETDSLAAGDTVTVIREDGEELEGTVEEAVAGTVTVLVTDDGPRYDEEVTVQDSDGNPVGTGKLYIHNPLAITGYAGTVKTVSVKENTWVGQGYTLFTLEDTKVRARYDTLLRERQEQEEILVELLTIYRDGAVLAASDGLVNTVLYEEDQEETAADASSDLTSLTAATMTGTSASGETEETEGTELLTFSPNTQVSVTIGVDETDILSLEVGQEAQVEVSSVTDEILLGTVTEINREANTASDVTQYSAVVTLDKVEGMLSGMTAKVDVRIQGAENALIIPLDALNQTRDTAFVYTGYDEETQEYTGRVEVTIGMQNDSYVEILSGLKAGDTVYYTEKQTNPFGFPMMGNMGNMGNMGGRSGMGGGENFPGGR